MKLKIKIGIIAIGVVLGCSTFAQDFSTAETESILEVREFEAIYSGFQTTFLPIIIPSGEMFLQPVGPVIPFDQSGFKNRFLKNLIGTLHSVSGVPIYTVFAMEDAASGEVILFNEDLGELARISRPAGYDSTAWAVEKFGSAITPYLLALYNPARMIAEYQIIPGEYYSDHVAALEAQALMEAAAAPMGMMMSMGSGGNEKATATMTPGSNGLVTLHITVPEGEDWRYLQIFKKDDLVYDTSWTLCDSWIPTYGSTTVSWQDPVPSGSEKFFHLSNSIDSDGDGRSDIFEAWNGTSSNTFNVVDAENGGIGDGMHDWWEEKLFGDLSQGPGDDFDGDLIANIDELIPGIPPTLVTDPSLYSSDGDALSDMEMFGLSGSKPTDPWNRDVSKPTVSILWPTNNAVVVF